MYNIPVDNDMHKYLQLEYKVQCILYHALLNVKIELGICTKTWGPIDLQQPWSQILVQEDVKPKYFKALARIKQCCAGSACLVGVLNTGLSHNKSLHYKILQTVHKFQHKTNMHPLN